jgi:2-desacetyl-2-hydroxyethyl bacteriochlorophyllide A dehydrogenase
MLPEKMKAIVAYGAGDYRFEEVDVPHVNDGEMLIKIEACGICASDIKCYKGAQRFWGGPDMPAYVKAPVIPGHEFVGTVVEIGDNVKGDWKIGDRICPEQIVPCGECMFCTTGSYWMCEKHDIYGFQNNVNGGMAEYVLLPSNSLNHKVPDDMAIEKAIFIEPYGCSWHCVDRAGISNIDTVVLAGAGTLGLGMIGAIKQRNPKLLIVLELRESRRQKALEFGADLVMDPSNEDVIKKIKEMTGGYGCDVYINATGDTSGVPQGLDAVRRLGTYVEFSVFGEATTVDWSIIGDQKELNLFGSHLSPYCYDTVIDWIGTDKMPTNGVVTHTFPLSEYKAALTLAKNVEDNAIKVILVP